MALKQVGARTEGDVYQGLFFWRQAAALLIPGSGVQQVSLEHDEASGVDDVAVFYEAPGVDAGGWLASADFYQLKYHVDRRDAYSAEALVDPAFIDAKASLLQRFHAAYMQLAGSHNRFRLHLASNWRWKDDDTLAGVLREYDGGLPDSFFTAGNASQLGRVRERWRSHLALHKDDFEAFGRTLRLQLDHFGRRHFREMVHDRLAAAGLRLPTGEQTASPYESLIQQFLMNGTNSFDAATFRELCVREGLMDESRDADRQLPAIGVRSFVRFAERIEEETDEFICVAENFEGRHPRGNSSWPKAVQMVTGFLGDAERRTRLRAHEHAVLLECHGSLAALAGYELSRNSGCAIFPVQKPERSLWKPTHPATPSAQEAWTSSTFPRDQNSQEIAVALSVTHDITADVVRYLDESGVSPVHALVCMQPTGGSGPDSVRGPEHALKLAAELVAAMRNMRPVPSARVHLFSSAPNSLLFFVGQFREALGRVVLYEYDFGFERDCSYRPSISLPPTDMNENLEVRDGT